MGEPRGHGAADDLDAVYRREVGRCTATLVRILGDVDLAEDAVAEAFAIAAEQWPVRGFPPNPGGWITTTARNRAIDRLRREASRDDRHRAAHRLHALPSDADPMDPLGDPTAGHPDLDDLDGFVDVVPDDQLRLMFLCCHPAIAPDAQVALTLRLLGGLDTPEIARAFLVPEATLAQRLVRAKRKLRDNHAPYRIPRAAELPDRLHAVLSAIYLIYTEGHTATSGDELTRVDLSREAIRLGRVLTELMPDEPEAVGLLALMLLTDARRPARTDAGGALVRLADQDRSLWDRALVDEGHGLVRACLRRDQPGPFQVQAAIAAVHADAARADDTDWDQIVTLYDLLLTLRPNPVVALNRAVAVGERDGPEAGLAALTELDAAQLDAYQPYHAARADLLARAGHLEAATDAYDRALTLTTNPTERAFLSARRAALAPPAG
ncbi:MAG: RNA polymerase subunit sigma-24 [Acidimicrobiales bacterium]|nr:RNA polymerase subunit sigma-24 [Acidimicrobiales bacterium]